MLPLESISNPEMEVRLVEISEMLTGVNPVPALDTGTVPRPIVQSEFTTLQ